MHDDIDTLALKCNRIDEVRLTVLLRNALMTTLTNTSSRARVFGINPCTNADPIFNWNETTSESSVERVKASVLTHRSPVEDLFP